MKINSIFFILLRAGLWEKEAELKDYNDLDFIELHQIAKEQSVIGLIAAGLEKMPDSVSPKESIFPFLQAVLNIEHKNLQMNRFVADLFVKLKSANVNVMLVKGQGIAQTYVRPLWRACGDVDLLLDADNYERAKEYLLADADKVEEENSYNKHFAMFFGPWEVELHGTLRNHLWKKLDSMIDAVQEDTFENQKVRLWENGEVKVALPAPDNDVVFVFAHILQHFFQGGIGLRQICDWCRLIWTFRASLDVALLESRLRSAGILTEWKAFAALAVNWLGMPNESMPLYSPARHWSRKAERIIAFVLETGNFGHNRDVSYYHKYSYLIRKAIAFGHHSWDSFRYFFIFPRDSARVWLRMLVNGLYVAVRRM